PPDGPRVAVLLHLPHSSQTSAGAYEPRGDVADQHHHRSSTHLTTSLRTKNSPARTGAFSTAARTPSPAAHTPRPAHRVAPPCRRSCSRRPPTPPVSGTPGRSPLAAPLANRRPSAPRSAPRRTARRHPSPVPTPPTPSPARPSPAPVGSAPEARADPR